MIGAVALVRNEVDILPLWLAAVARWADVVVLMDHNSSDGSEKLLRAAALRPGWSYLPQFSRGFFQAEFMEQGAALAFGEGVDWVLPLDADEFLRSPQDLPKALGALAPWQAGAFAWRNAVPKDLPTVYLAPALSPVHKVALSKTMWDAGHRWDFGNQKILSRPSKVIGELVHLPIRSKEQVEKKRTSLNTGLALAGKKLRVFGTGNLLAQAITYPVPSNAVVDASALASWPLMDLSI